MRLRRREHRLGFRLQLGLGRQHGFGLRRRLSLLCQIGDQHRLGRGLGFRFGFRLAHNCGDVHRPRPRFGLRVEERHALGGGKLPGESQVGRLHLGRRFHVLRFIGGRCDLRRSGIPEHGRAAILGAGQCIGEFIAEMRATSLATSGSLRVGLGLDARLRLGLHVVLV